MKKQTVSSLKKKADATFSQYIRMKYADPHTGLATCVTCGVQKPWKQMQAGHYEKRSVNHLRFDERNVHVQCAGCNVFQSGNYPRYAQYMIKTYGEEILDTLSEEAKTIKQFKPNQLSEIISLYKAKIALLTSD